MHETGTNVPSTVCGFHTKRGKWNTIGFFKTIDFKVSYPKF